MFFCLPWMTWWTHCSTIRWMQISSALSNCSRFHTLSHLQLWLCGWVKSWQCVLNWQLTGSVLEDAWKESGKAHMDELIQRIETILLDATCSRCGSPVPSTFFFFCMLKSWHKVLFSFHISLFRDVRQMLLKLVELRSSDWGRVRDAVAASNATPDNDPNYFMVRVGRAARALLLVFVSHRLVFPVSEWTHILHWGWRSFYSSRPRWDQDHHYLKKWLNKYRICGTCRHLNWCLRPEA